MRAQKAMIPLACSVLSFWLGMITPSIADASKPSPPAVDRDAIRRVLDSAAAGSADADACSKTNNIASGIAALSSLLETEPYTEKGVSDQFDSRRAYYTRSINFFQKAKICYIKDGETRSRIIEAETSLKKLTASLIENKNTYLSKMRAWESEQERLADERRAEQNRKAIRIAEEFGRYVIFNQYDGGQSINVNVKSHEWYGDGEIRLKVEMTWLGRVSGQSGYGADGTLTVIYDDSPSWVMGKNVRWSPSWHSQELKNYVEGRQTGRLFRGLLGG